jgi:hypothetical protein
MDSSRVEYLLDGADADDRDDPFRAVRRRQVRKRTHVKLMNHDGILGMRGIIWSIGGTAMKKASN